MPTYRVLLPFEVEAPDPVVAEGEAISKLADDHGLLYAEIAVLEVAPAS